MINWTDLNNLHIVKKTKNIIYKWWKVDMITINAKDLSNPEFDFQNPLIKQLFQKQTVQESLFKILSIIQEQNIKNVKNTLHHWKHTGLNVFIVPIQDFSYVTGFVIAAGFLPEKTPPILQNLRKQWQDLDFSEEWCLKNEEFLPIISDHDNSHFVDLLEITAQEISSVQQEFIDKNHNLQSLSTTHSLSYGQMVGKSKIMNQLYNLLDKIKHSENTILIQGENGTGKELIAKSIHQNSAKKNQQFITQNCSALNDNLLESELFGHVKGAFTGAYKDKKGLFELADKGTLFLDEIGDTSPAMQVKILRIIQEGTFFPVGGTQSKKVDVRIISATNKNLNKMIAEKTFREDLYYRLNVINIQVPPLRDREEDIPLLAEFFINKYSKKLKVFTNKALKRLSVYPWPGNVRELQNETERLAVLTGSDTYIKEEFLSEKIKNKERTNQLISFLNSDNHGQNMKKAIALLERQMIFQSLKQEKWNKSRVAKKLGISRAALVSKVKTYKLEKRVLQTTAPLKKNTSV